jgi:hypothetical protein
MNVTAVRSISIVQAIKSLNGFRSNVTLEDLVITKIQLLAECCREEYRVSIAKKMQGNVKIVPVMNIYGEVDV